MHLVERNKSSLIQTRTGEHTVLNETDVISWNTRMMKESGVKVNVEENQDETSLDESNEELKGN